MPLTDWINKAYKDISLLSPFFAYSMYDIPVYEDDSKGTAYTNGVAVYMPTWAYEKWGQAGCTAVFLHEIMHIVLLHIPRMSGKDQEMWNIATDAVINGFIAGTKTDRLVLPEGCVRIPKLEHLSAEEIFEKLKEEAKKQKQNGAQQGGGGDKPDFSKMGVENGGNANDLVDDGSMSTKAQKEAEGRLAKAKTVFYSNLAGNMKREVEAAMKERVNWTALLSRYLVKFSDDYSFSPCDRRFEDFFVPDIVGEKITGRIEVDTSGSISPDQLAVYVGQIVSLLNSFPKVELTVSLFHTESYAEYQVDGVADLSKLQAQSGGTSFVDSLQKAEKQGVDFVVFLTDLYGEFPAKEPNCDVIWLTNGGEEAPFGIVMKIEE